MIKLYGFGRSRATIVQWYLEELAVPYELVVLDGANQEHLKSDFLAINPFGKVPAINDDGFYLSESGAILLYLADKYGKMSTSLQERSIVLQWILFANATLGPGIFNEVTRAKESPRLLGALELILQKQPFIMGKDFSVADVAVGATLAYISLLLKMDLSAYPAVTDYINRMLARPCMQKAMGNRQ